MKTTPAPPGDARTPSGARLPDLRIVPCASLLLHEECDPARVESLASALHADGVLRHPPIVAALEGQTYVVLDGANRVTALQHTGVPDALVQVVDYDDPAVTLEVWAHLLRDGGLIAVDQGALAPHWLVMPPDDVRAGLTDGTLTCGIVTFAKAWGLALHAGFADRIRALREIVAGYKGKAPIYRVQPAGLDALVDEYDRIAALVLFPRLTKADIRAIARLPVKLPSGISRHIVPQRALRVNIDLALLQRAEPVAVKQARLDESIRARLIEHRIRHYPEATVLYDE